MPMSYTGIALVFIIFFSVVLVILLIKIFGNFDFQFPGSNGVDEAVRRTLGKLVLLSALLGIGVVLFIIFGADSPKYSVGAVASLLALYLLGCGIRSALRYSDSLETDTPETLITKIHALENSLAMNGRGRTVRLVSRLFLIPVILSLYLTSSTNYLSFFDIFGLILLLVTLEVPIIAHTMEKKKRLAALRAELENKGENQRPA